MNGASEGKENVPPSAGRQDARKQLGHQQASQKGGACQQLHIDEPEPIHLLVEFLKN
jgi:hypothetical protein